MTNEEYIRWLKLLDDELTFDALVDGKDEMDMHEMIWALCEKLEQESKTDIRECGSCKYSKDGHIAGTEECHDCMWESKQQPKTDGDCISRQAVLDIHAKFAEYMGATKFWQFRDDINNLPSITPVPKVGHWVFTDKAHEYAKCSECGYYGIDLVGGEIHNYCQCCGAKMSEIPTGSESEG